MNYQYNVVIPLAGQGKRFRDAGFTNHKSILDISGYSMLERIIEKFPYSPEFFFLTSHNIYKSISNHVEQIAKKYSINICLIDDHKEGPAYSLFKSLDQLPQDSVTFLSYTDITWSWTYDQFHEMYNSNASVACHNGFHPHLVNNNFSAFCKEIVPKNTHISGINYLDKIKEKSSFTTNWMDELISIGLFQFKSLSFIKKYLLSLIKNEDRVAGEFFPSLLFNYIKADYAVKLVNIKAFVHYGDPSSYKDFTMHAKNLYELSLAKNRIKEYKSNFKSVIYISGKGSRMKSISSIDKADLSTGNMTLLDAVFYNLPINQTNSKIVCNESQNLISQSFKIASKHRISPTSSQLDSLLFSENVYSSLSNFFICSCDCFAPFDVQKLKNLCAKNNSDIVLFGFEPSLLQSKLSEGSISSFNYCDDLVHSINVKQFSKDSQTLGLCGFFFIKSGLRFSDWVKKTRNEIKNKNRELIIDDVFASLDTRNIKINYIKVNDYIHLGTPEEYLEYKYWSSTYSLLTSGVSD